jgi:hypothetical protein
MRAVVASLFAVALLLSPLPATPSPPDDIAAYCRAAHPQVPFQVRCLNIENAAAARVGRVGPGADPDGWNRCRATTPSWSAMEQCMAESARAATPGGGATGAVGPAEQPVPPATTGAPRPEGGEGTPPATPPVAATPPPPATPPSPVVPGSSTVILGPQPTPTLPAERDRPTRPISEADADRHLRSVLERNPSARCTKKQYGPGWVISCE